MLILPKAAGVSRLLVLVNNEDAFPLLGEITAAECAKWLTETLAPERLALSVVAPKGGEDDADDDA